MAALESLDSLASDEVPSTQVETKTEVISRHKKELKDMQYQNRQRIKQAKSVQGKGQKDAIAEATAMNLRSEDELQYRHRGELEVFDDISEEEEEVDEVEVIVPKPEPIPTNNKKSKAAKKREKERLKVKEREERIAAEKAGAGPTPRDIELAVISEKISKGNEETTDQPQFPPLRIYDILADGHCLYRSIAHQRQLRGDKADYQSVRLLASTYMREHGSEFIPFLDLEKYSSEKQKDDDAAYNHYCDNVEKSSEWGGHLELLALSHSLKTPIRIHSAENPKPLIIGWNEYGKLNPSPFEICYHLHFYALGEHYNSTLPL